MLEGAAGYDPRRKSGCFQHAVVRPADLSPTRVGATEEDICTENNSRFDASDPQAEFEGAYQIHAALLQWPALDPVLPLGNASGTSVNYQLVLAPLALQVRLDLLRRRQADMDAGMRASCIVIADLQRCGGACFEQEPRKRSQRSLAIRRCHTAKSHVVNNQVELERDYPGGDAASEQASLFVSAVPTIPSSASCVTVISSEENTRDSQATNSSCNAQSADNETCGVLAFRPEQ
jgi:hypothetical protein